MSLISVAAEFLILLIGGEKKISRNTLPQLMVSQHLALGVGETVGLPQWGASCWWKLCILGFFLVNSWMIFTIKCWPSWVREIQIVEMEILQHYKCYMRLGVSGANLFYGVSSVLKWNSANGAKYAVHFCPMNCLKYWLIFKLLYFSVIFLFRHILRGEQEVPDSMSFHRNVGKVRPEYKSKGWKNKVCNTQSV